ncbi:MAG: hypothetical protein HYU98_03595, partial [Deltaproteobacteria bacterium]|nr:hypothetical protein [Deltaproteobacteria bacterium]
DDNAVSAPLSSVVTELTVGAVVSDAVVPSPLSPDVVVLELPQAAKIKINPKHNNLICFMFLPPKLKDY